MTLISIIILNGIEPLLKLLEGISKMIFTKSWILKGKIDLYYNLKVCCVY